MHVACLVLSLLIAADVNGNGHEPLHESESVPAGGMSEPSKERRAKSHTFPRSLHSINIDKHSSDNDSQLLQRRRAVIKRMSRAATSRDHTSEYYTSITSNGHLKGKANTV